MTLTACTKIKYASRADAAEAARRGAGTNGKMRAYECDDCPPGTWHLTSQPKSEARRHRKRKRKQEGTQ